MAIMTSPEERDIPYAHELYGRLLESVLVDGKRLGSILVDGKYNLWDVFAHIAFFDDCVRFSATKQYSSVEQQYRRAHKGSFRGSAFFIGMILWMVTMCATSLSFAMRRRVLVFSVDKDSARTYHADFRIEGIYEILRAKRISHTEFFHTLVTASSITRLFGRGRFAMYLEGVDWLYFVLRALRRVFVGRGSAVAISGTDSFSKDERQFIHALVQKYVSVAPLVRFRIRVIRSLLWISGTKLIVGIDDARYYHELSAAAKELGIPFYVYQHGSGHFTPYHVGWLKDARLEGERMFPSDIVVWNQYWKSELGWLGAVWGDEHIHVGGNAKMATGVGLKKGHVGDPILIPYETDAPKQLVRSCVEGLGLLNIPIIFKLRPDVPRSVQEEILKGVNAQVAFETEVTTPVSAVLGVYSTVLYESVAAGIPTGVIDSELLYAKRFVDNGLCNPVSLESLSVGIHTLQELSPEELTKRKSIATPVSFKEHFERMLKKYDIV